MCSPRKVLVIFSDFHQTWIFSADFRENKNSLELFNNIRLVRAEFSFRTEGQRDALWNMTEASKKVNGLAYYKAGFITRHLSKEAGENHAKTQPVPVPVIRAGSRRIRADH